MKTKCILLYNLVLLELKIITICLKHSVNVYINVHVKFLNLITYQDKICHTSSLLHYGESFYVIWLL